MFLPWLYAHVQDKRLSSTRWEFVSFRSFHGPNDQ